MALPPQAIIGLVSLFLAIPPAFDVLWRSMPGRRARSSTQHAREPRSTSTLTLSILFGHHIDTREIPEDAVVAMEEGRPQSNSDQAS